MEIRLVACERMSGTKCSKKTPLSLCFVKQPVCNGDEACRLRAYVRDTMLEKDSIEFVLREAACLQWRLGLSPASVCQGHNSRKKTPLSLCFVKQPVCNGDEACRLRAYVRDTMLEKRLH
ncbi:unnamed protein product [Prunus armeniaca]